MAAEPLNRTRQKGYQRIASVLQDKVSTTFSTAEVLRAIYEKYGKTPVGPEKTLIPGDLTKVEVEFSRDQHDHDVIKGIILSWYEGEPIIRKP